MIINLIPDHDTFAEEGDPTATKGTQTVLLHREWGSARLIPYMKWSAALIAANQLGSKNIYKAVLNLYVSAAIAAYSAVPVFQVNADWDESTLTWNNKPAVTGSSIGTISFAVTGYATLDITSIVKSWCNGTINPYGLRFHNGGTTAVDINTPQIVSSEGVANKPFIAITTISGGLGIGSPMIF